ncbi:deoxyribodipyrimidine photo-lyase [Paucihalobacter ruber]|uniref:Deoxyribodipyrimidine photo-lyase n=1 Tax=Paucihalobacter ruber TaxID=2567861 RepID=A0A506PJD8_9FLAO|nr:deoxyribodipyrimidine photo-lyase [Paucihalobacter ruber]TPV33192.1 deoxyribodipyrimidine photo-lyase [Paucihalobacter ruber]
MQEINIFWFRRDLRLEDNAGLFHAFNEKLPVLPIFIFDEDILNKLPKNDSRVNFIHDTLSNINNQLKKHTSGISIFHGKPLDVFNRLVHQYAVKTVFTNRDYEPYATERDNSISEFLKSRNIAFKTFKDQVIFEKNEVVKNDGKPYVVYTPYSRKWLELFSADHVKPFNSEGLLNHCFKDDNLPFLSLSDIGFVPSPIKVANFQIDNSLIDDYEATRNFPAKDETSRVGPHLRFGTVSVRRLVEKASIRQNQTYLKELIWREFFMQILWHFPNTSHKSFKPQYDRIEWRNNEEEFKKWCDGNTGYPLVDAGMRQLNETGFMHNRVRMLVGSFLCKHLLIDWRWGEAYFAEKLHDYEMASNVGNWQWVAGCGVDAAPYFRIFNPTTQIDKFDKEHKYINKWVKNLNSLDYPTPIVDHKMARERCLQVYKTAVS